MIAVVDYGAGNLYSLCNSLSFLSITYEVTADANRIQAAQGVILPGVGAFPDAMGKLRAAGFIEPLLRAGAEKPLLGICLGMQLLFDTSVEFVQTSGLGLIPGTVEPIQAPGLKIPHMGWNSVDVTHPCALSAGVQEGDYLYFVHSFCACTEDAHVSLSTSYGQQIPALVHRGNVYGAQFHPEKSARVGLQILKSFGELTNT